MSGSKGGKNSSRKGKAKYSKPETTGTKTEALVNLELSASGSDAIKPLLIASESSYTLNELEHFLFFKLELLYTKVEYQLWKRYGSAVKPAILHAGFIDGQMDIFNNICQNTIAYLEKKAEPRTKVFNDLDELMEYTFQTMVSSLIENKRKPRRGAIWHLLVKNWGFTPSTEALAHLRSNDMSSIWFLGSYDDSSLSRNEDPSSADKEIGSSSKRVGLLERVNLTPALLSRLKMNTITIRDDIKRKIEDRAVRPQSFPCVTGKPTEIPNIVEPYFLKSITDFSFGKCLMECLESNSHDPKTTLIVDLVKATRALHEKAKEQKEWAKKKVIDSAKRFNKDLMELKMLKMIEFDWEFTECERQYAEKSSILMLMETQHGLRKMNSEAIFLVDTEKRLERENVQMMADIEALKFGKCEYEKELEEVLKRERRCMRKITDAEKQTSIFQSQYEEEKQRAVQLEMELKQAEKEAFEVELQCRRETAGKEAVQRLVAGERKNLETQKAKSQAELLELQQKVDMDSQLGKDDIQRLECDLHRLQLAKQLPDTFLEDEAFWRDDAESSLLGSAALMSSPEETTRHWLCMMCLQNEVCVVFLPCTHQVMCLPCCSEMAGGWCPCCHVKIEESVEVHGPSA